MVTTTIIKKGYKQTDLGVIPEDWDVKKLGDIFHVTRGQVLSMKKTTEGIIGESKYPVYSSQTKDNGLAGYYKNYLFENCITWTTDGANAGDVKFRAGKFYCTNVCGVLESNEGYANPCIAAIFNSISRKYVSYVGNPKLMNNVVAGIRIGIPHLIQEQTTIAAVLSDTDALIEYLEKLITKKKAIKQGAIQQLLTGKKRLPGFNGEWDMKSLEEIIVCLDNLRVPLNDKQRSKIKGDYPYCGANGVLDYVNDYVIDDDIILIAEDGGYFDEYAYRPIAYRMYGKSWVNNHAHILKAKDHVYQDFIYYSLVHKNIQSFLASGTRAKLNKSEMYKIEINIPKEKSEQTAIAKVLSDMDAEIKKLGQERDKYTMLKQGMMQQLLTGKIRIYGTN
jgi:type I restriction enzyme S subunit